jgi:hypothetical protein
MNISELAYVYTRYRDSIVNVLCCRYCRTAMSAAVRYIYFLLLLQLSTQY